MAITTNQRDAASGAAAASPLGPVGHAAIRNLLLAYIAENAGNATSIGGVLLSSLGTGILKLTAGVPSLAVAGVDYSTPAYSVASRYASIR